MPKTPKRFAEEGGLSHLLALSQQAVEKKDAQFQKRIERREVVRNSQEKARKERVQRKVKTKQEAKTPTRTMMMNALREKAREKARTRKLVRKQKHAPGGQDAQSALPRSIIKSQPQSTKKRVSFG